MTKTLFATPLLALALTGCVSFGGKTPKLLLDLTPTARVAPGAGKAGTFSSALSVVEPSADQKVAVTRVPVQVNAATVAYLKNATWVERPARLFQHLLAETLRAKGGQLVIEGDNGTAGKRLSGRLIDMGYDARSSSVVVRFEAVEETRAGEVRTRRFDDVIPGVPAKAEPVAHAINRAANKVAQDVADWVD